MSRVQQPLKGCQGLVFMIDDEPSVRKAISRLLRSMGFCSEIFGSAEEFLDREPYEGVGCIILDVRMPGLTGVDLQDQLAISRCSLPIVFITGGDTLPRGIMTMKNSAVSLLRKPFDDNDLMQTVTRALQKHQESRKSVGLWEFTRRDSPVFASPRAPLVKTAQGPERG